MAVARRFRVPPRWAPASASGCSARCRSSASAPPSSASRPALTLGLIGGIELDPVWLSVVLPATILGVLYLGDHPRLFRGYRHQVVTLDRAIADERELVERLETTLGCRVGRYELRKLDLVTTRPPSIRRLRDRPASA
jgi:hypothetical protein